MKRQTDRQTEMEIERDRATTEQPSNPLFALCDGLLYTRWATAENGLKFRTTTIMKTNKRPISHKPGRFPILAGNNTILMGHGKLDTSTQPITRTLLDHYLHITRQVTQPITCTLLDKLTQPITGTLHNNYMHITRREAAGEFSSLELTLCADSQSVSLPPPCYGSGT